jgi:hypothetical protein
MRRAAGSLSAPTLVLVAAVVLVAASVVGAVTYKMFGHRAAAQSADMTSCNSLDAHDAAMTLKVTLTTQNRDTPLLARHLRIELPADQALAGDLEESRDSVLFKSAVQCLRGSDGIYRDDRHDSAPRITKTDNRIVLEDDERIDISSRSSAYLDSVSATEESDHHWRIDVEPPAALAGVQAWEVSVEAPPDSLYGPAPWPPTGIKPTQIAWASKNTAAPAAQYTVFIRHGDRDVTTVFSGRGIGNVLASGLFWLDDFAMPLILFIFLLQLRRRKVLTGVADAVSPRALLLLISRRRRVKISLAERVSAPVLYVVPTVLLGLAGLTIAVIQAWVSPDYSHWPGLIRCMAAGAMLVAAVSARIWRVDEAIWAGLAGLGYAALLVATVTNMQTSRLVQSLNWALYTFALAMLIVAGVFEAITRLMASHGYRPSKWIPILGACTAAALTIERVVLDVWFYHQQEWLDTAPTGAGWLNLDLQNAAYTTLSTLSGLIVAVPVFSLWKLCRALDETKARTRAVPALGGALVAYGVLYWALPWSAWTIPVGIPSAIGVYLYLRTRGYLTARVDETRTVAELIEGNTLSQLQDDVRRAQVRQQRRKALERSLSTGRDETQGVRTWQQGIARQHDPARRTTGRVGQGVGSKPPMSMPTRGGPLTEDVDPVDILLAVGPSTSPAQNAIYALTTALPISILAAAFTTWMWLRNNPLSLPNLTDNAIFTAPVDDFVWTALEYAFGAAAIGLLWHYLPGKRGAAKVVPVVAAYAVTPVLRIVLPALLGGHVGLTPLADVALFTAIMMYVGVRMDEMSLRGPGTIWTSRRKIVFEAYRMQNVATLVTFVAANIGVVITIWNLFHGTGAAGGGHDPSLVNHPSGGGTR